MFVRDSSYGNNEIISWELGTHFRAIECGVCITRIDAVLLRYQ